MRRAVLALAVGMLLSTAACGSSRNPAPGVATNPAAPGATAAVQPALAAAKASCEALGQVYSKNIGPFAEALNKMVASHSAPDGAKASREQAQQKLSAFAKAIRDATQASTHTDMRATGVQTADRLQATAADDTFFNKIKTAKDVETVLGPTLKEWLAPVTTHCS